MLKFMGEHPILTFFLALIAHDIIVNVAKAICGNN